MRWSKLRSLVKRNFAYSVQDRIDIHSAAYGNCSCGHAWLTLDNQVVANFCTRANAIAKGLESGSAKVGTTPRHQFVEYGELSRQDAYQACWDVVHSLPIEAALIDPDPLVQALAVLDRRLGKRRLSQIDRSRLHRLAAMMLDVRREADKLMPSKVVQLAPEIEMPIN